MAHTLKAYYYTDPATAVTVDFYSAVADNDGIAVDSYQMGVPGIEQARNNSLYSDSPRPVYSKHSTVTDVLTVTVRGSTNTALYTNLHLLAKLGEYARRASQNPASIVPSHLELKPGGSAAGEVLYAMIYDVRVELPADWANTQDATLTVEDVTVTIERGLWQKYKYGLNGYQDGWDYIYGTTNPTVEYHAGSASSTVDVGGDTWALWQIQFAPKNDASTPAIDRAIIGYRSKSMGGANYASLGKKEAESQTNGTDTSDAADATASGGNKVECTFATGTAATRLSGTGIPHGIHRVFARMKANGTQVATVYLSATDTTGTIANASVTVSSTSWLVYDLGVIRLFQNHWGAILTPTSTGSWTLTGSGTPAAGNLDIDYLFFMPTEGYVTASGIGIPAGLANSGKTLTINNQVLPQPFVAANNAAVAYTISLDPVPGACAFYWLMGTDAGSVFDVGITQTIAIANFLQNPRYIMPSLV